MSQGTSVASVWRHLNQVGLRVGAAAGFGAATAYLSLLIATGDRVFLLQMLLGVAVGLAGLHGMRRPEPDMEIVLLTASAAVAASAAIVAPAVRPGLWGVVAVIGTVGSLLLDDRKRRRFVAVIAALILGQLLWPALGYGTLVDGLSTFVLSAVCTVAGIAIVRSAKSALDRSEHTRIEIFRSVPVGLFRCSPAGTIIDANPALARVLQHDQPDDLVGLQIADLHEVPDEWHALCDELRRSTAPQRFAHRMIPHTGETLWVRGFAQAVRDEGGGVIYLEGSIEDVTQRREVEESARLHESRFRNVFERAPIAIWEEDFSKVGLRLAEMRSAGVTDLRSHLEGDPDEVRHLISLIGFVDVNPAGIALIGASSKEAALRGLDPETMPDDVAGGFVDEFVAIWEDRDAMTIEIRGTTADGGGTDLALSWSVGRDPDGGLDLSGVLVAIQDIAIVKQAERDLAALVEAKDDLVASVSHELRTPITTILGMAFELRDHNEHFTPDEIGELVDIIADQSRELSNIVEDLLVAAWSDAGTLSVQAEVVNITTELGRIVPSRPGSPIIDVTRPILAWADPLRLRQIMRNLLTNAARYGGPTVTIRAEPGPESVTVLVQDDGPGVPEADRARIFEAYFRAETDHAMPGSLGLGLPVSRRLARLMGGDLTYRYDGGSIFELELPSPLKGHFQ